MFGQLGDSTLIDRLVPTDVTGLTSGVDSISVGPFNTCAVTATGGAKCWGQNGNGHLGDNTTTSRSAPVDVSGLLVGVIKVSAGTYSACAVTSSSGAKCWGLNGSGQLGDGTLVQRKIPVDVVGLASGVSGIAVGSNYTTCAALAGGGAKCWGNNNAGQLGDATMINRSTPVDVLQ